MRMDGFDVEKVLGMTGFVLSIGFLFAITLM